MVVPILFLIFYIFYLLVWTGQQEAAGGESFIELIELSNSYQALLWGVRKARCCFGCKRQLFHH